MPIIPSLGTGEWRRMAIGVLLVIGSLASLGAAVGQVETVITQGLGIVGTAAVVVAGGSIIGPVVRRSITNNPGPTGLTRSQRRVTKETTPLELYQAEGCPYCRRVRNFCTRAGISVVLHNPRSVGTMLTPGRVTNDMAYDDLRGYGKDQIPLLVDTERKEAIYESDEIIDYLRTQYV